MPDLTEFDQLLRREMTTAPSGEFLARARARIDEEVVSRRSSWRWLVPVCGMTAACAVLVVAGVLNNGPVTLPNVSVAPSLVMPQPIRMLEAPAIQASTAPMRTRVARTHALNRGVTVSPRDEPIVIVDERQRMAIATLIGIIREGKLTDESFANTTPVSMGAIRDRVVPVDVAPLTVSPIDADGVLQIER